MKKMKWRMCPKCGVKLILESVEIDVLVYVCPVCKYGQMILRGETLKRVEKAANEINKTIEELIIEALDVIKCGPLFADNIIKRRLRTKWT